MIGEEQLTACFNALRDFFSGGTCPVPGALGECAAADVVHVYDDGSGVRCEAQCYVWQKDYNDSAAVAEIVARTGGKRVWVQHTLFSYDNGDRNGWCDLDHGHHIRHWIISWDEPSRLPVAPARAVQSVVGSRTGETLSADAALARIFDAEVPK